MDKGHAVHPSNSLAQLPPDLSQEMFIELGVLFLRIYEIKQLGSADLFQDETVMGGCGERVEEGDDVRVADVLKMELGQC